MAKTTKEKAEQIFSVSAQTKFEAYTGDERIYL